MRVAVAAFAALAAVVSAIPQGVTSAIAPAASTPAGCATSVAGTFQITVVNVTNTKRSLDRRDILTLTLNNGILKDAKNRIGYIASNYQFQFDGPPQAGAIYTAGFSLCQNGTLALGGSAVWYQCLSGDFYNLYDRHWAAQCNAIYLYSQGQSGGSAAQATDGQPVASQRTDGQPLAPTGGSPVSVISDGQPQAPTGRVSQISDGQIQAPTGRPVSQISDGQIQNPTGSRPTGVPVSQISDGQIQASPRPTGTPVQQISDGQIQASPKPTGTPVSQISDGQIQAGASATKTSAPVQFTGAAAPLRKGDAVAVVAGVAAALAML